MASQIRVLCVLLALGLALSAPGLASDWPHIRGPQTDGRVSGADVFKAENLGLSTAWRVELGSAYSGIAIADGLVVTTFTDKKADWIAALAADTGKEVWRQKLGEYTQGQDGADDGPLSNPTLGHGLVYAIGFKGQLLAVSLKDGKVRWTRDLAADFGGQMPTFGFTTTPLLVGKTLVVQAGGPEGKAIVGLNAKSGKTIWTHGNGKVIYQSPVLMTLAGQEMVVAVDGAAVMGLDAAKGTIFWEHPLAEGDRAASATPAFIGDDRFLLAMNGDGTAYKVSKTGDAFTVEELYRTKDMGKNYATPVYHDGLVFGFRGQVLTCFKADTGERVWRSRPPGGDGLILVDDNLVIFGKDGNVVVAEASGEGYKERAIVQALDESSLSWPSYADGHIFVRNLTEIAAIAVMDAPAAPAAAAGE